MKWITRERPKIDPIACPWLIASFIDNTSEFLYVPASDVLRVAQDMVHDVPTGLELPDSRADSHNQGIRPGYPLSAQ
jgi:hypothetical protein